MAESITASVAPSLRIRDGKVRILNPMPGGSTHTSPARALRFIYARRAYADAVGNLVFLGVAKAKSRHSACLPVVDRASGLDAFPDRAVFPPSPEVLSRMAHKVAPLRPPVRGEAR